MYQVRRRETMKLILQRYTIIYNIAVVLVLLLSLTTTTNTISATEATPRIRTRTRTRTTFENSTSITAHAASINTIVNNKYDDNKNAVHNNKNNEKFLENDSIYIPKQFYTNDTILLQKEQNYISFPRWEIHSTTASTNNITSVSSVIDSIVLFIKLQSNFFLLYNNGHYDINSSSSTKKLTPLNLPLNYTLDHPPGVVNWKWPESFYIINIYTIYYSRSTKQLIHRWNKGTYILKMNTTELLIYNSIQLFHNIYLSTTSTTSTTEQQTNTIVQQRWPNLYNVLILQNSSFPFLAHYSDYTGCNYHNWANYTLSIPLFTVAAQRSNNKCNNTFPFPNYHTISNTIKKQSSNWDTTFLLYTHKYGSYSSKISKLIWRGSLTGYTTKKIRPPRYRLFQLLYSNNNFTSISKEDRELLFDVQLTSIPKGKELYYMTNNNHNNNSNTTDDLDLLNLFTTDTTTTTHDQKSSTRKNNNNNKIPMDDFQYYKAILDIDGHSWSSRFGNILCTTSIVLKIQPDWVDYFYYPKYSQYSNNDNDSTTGGSQYKNNRLLPWKHYIPIRKDMSDLLDKVRYVVNPINEKHVVQIISNAQQWCRTRMTTSEVSYDALDIFESYLNVLQSTGSTSSSISNNNMHNSKETWTNVWTPTVSNSFIGQFANNHPQQMEPLFPMGIK